MVVVFKAYTVTSLHFKQCNLATLTALLHSFPYDHYQ